MEAECGFEPTDNLWSKCIIAESHQECRVQLSMVLFSFYVIRNVLISQFLRTRLIGLIFCNKWSSDSSRIRFSFLLCNMLQHQTLLKCSLFKKKSKETPWNVLKLLGYISNMFYECLFSKKRQLLASNATFSLVILIKERKSLQKTKK